jgi:hypothetical protein
MEDRANEEERGTNKYADFKKKKYLCTLAKEHIFSTSLNTPTNLLAVASHYQKITRY